VSRSFLRLGLASSDATKLTARSRSKIQYAAVATTKKIPRRISNALIVTSSAGWNSSRAFGSSRKRLSTAVSSSCLMPFDFLASRWICAFVVPPSALCTWSTARGTTIQRANAMIPASAR
jgi:hypothetical protein